jgi:hypothetical protein
VLNLKNELPEKQINVIELNAEIFENESSFISEMIA